MALKQLFSLKITKIVQYSATRSPCVVRLSYYSLLSTLLCFDIFWKKCFETFAASLPLPPLAKSWLRAYPCPSFWASILQYLFFIKRGISDDVIACNLWFRGPSNQKSWLRIWFSDRISNMGNWNKAIMWMYWNAYLENKMKISQEIFCS